jgi:Flavin containing amine oxidoreductase
VAGLAATGILKRAGHDVVCLEATDRIGGRILTVHDPLAPIAVELGAEFVHGRPPETWELIRAANLTSYEHTAQALHLGRGGVVQQKRVGELADRVLSQLAKSSRRKDESFEDYLRRCRQPAAVKNWARVHIEGFNAARADLISVTSLTEDSEAADKIEGDRTFRIPAGYDSIPISLLQSIPDYQSVVHLNSIVERVHWRRGAVEIHYRSALDRQPVRLKCRQLIVTVPLGVLQASYVPVNALADRKTLAEAVESTLFFAGEATNLNGHSGTVHGAIESGVRAAALVDVKSDLNHSRGQRMNRGRISR